MKFKTLLVLMVVTGCLSARAQTVQDDVAALEKKRTAEVARATDGVNRGYLREYEKLLQRANLIGDAQGANLVRTMIRRLNPEPESVAPADKNPSATDPTAVLTSNHWIDESTAQNGHHHVFPREFLPGGQMTSSFAHQSGNWKIVNNELVIEMTAYPDWIERFSLPVQREKWRGTDKSGTPFLMSVDKSSSSGGTSATASSPMAKPTGSPANPADYFGKPNP